MISKRIERYKSGIYKITNLVNQKFYIGGSVNVYNRMHTHRTKLKNKNHSCKHLEYSYHKYGEDNFLFEVIEYCKQDELVLREQYYLDLLKPEYNKRTLAQINQNLEVTKQTREKISNTLKKRYEKGEISAYNQSHKFRIVQQFTLELELITEFTCPIEAEQEYQVTPGNISRACNSKSGYFSNFLWKYKDDSKQLVKYSEQTPPGRKIKVFHLLRNEEKEFESITAFAAFINKPLKHIRRHINKEPYLNKYKIIAVAQNKSA